MALGLRAGLSLGVFAAFLLRNLYMIHFELVWRGATPGKRLMGIKVIDRHGGPLLPGAVIARNLTREIEYFLPVGLLSAGAARGAPGSPSAWGSGSSSSPCCPCSTVSGFGPAT
jgi:Predicted membrane protein/domain